MTGQAGPRRIQLRRTAGWRMPAGAVKVDRSTRWGNPITRDIVRRMWDDRWGPCTEAAWRAEAVRAFRQAVLDGEDYVPPLATIRSELGGRDLACWCPDDQPCHADVLLELANPPEETR